MSLLKILIKSYICPYLSKGSPMQQGQVTIRIFWTLFCRLFFVKINLFSKKMQRRSYTCMLYSCLAVSLPFHKQVLAFTCLPCESVENCVGKVEIACNDQFLLVLQRFLPFRRTFLHFFKCVTVVCKLV